jgi:hypothetical protein
MNNQGIYLPTSGGEAMDKLTILDIKLDKIKDHRRTEVQKEYDLLYDLLTEPISNHKTFYDIMKNVNLSIWDMMDIIRDGNYNEREYANICKKCIEYNDIRFRIKNKINHASSSFLKEQKGYTQKIVHLSLEPDVDIIPFIKPITYLSYIYDLVIINTTKQDLKDIFQYDPYIQIECSKMNKDIHTFTFNQSYNELDICNILGIDTTEPLFNYV